jgi:hypothetical protein
MEPVSRDEALGAAVVAVMAAGGALWLGHWGWPWALDINDPEFNPLIGFLALLIGLSGWHGLKALRYWQRHRAFGTLGLILDPPGDLRPGQPLTGILRSEGPVAATGPFRLVLTCHDVHEFESSSDPGRWYRRAFPVWSDTRSLPAESDAQRGLRFQFTPPAHVGPDPVPSGIYRQNGLRGARFSLHIPGLQRVFARNHPPVDRTWTLTVTAPTRGPGFRAEVTVPQRRPGPGAA